MKKVVGRLIVIGVLGFGVYKAGLWIAHKLVKNTVITVQVDLVFSSETSADLERISMKYFSPFSHDWINVLKQHVPLVDHATSARDGKNIMVTIFAVPLVFFVPDDVVVDMNGNVYTKNFVNTQVLNSLKIITVAKKADSAESEFKIFVQKISVFIKEQYDIFWKSPHEIYLKPLNGGSTSIIRYDKIPTEKQLVLGQQLLEKYKNKKKEERVVDFRFVDQIVLSLAKHV